MINTAAHYSNQEKDALYIKVSLPLLVENDSPKDLVTNMKGNPAWNGNFLIAKQTKNVRFVWIFGIFQA